MSSEEAFDLIFLLSQSFKLEKPPNWVFRMEVIVPRVGYQKLASFRTNTPYKKPSQMSMLYEPS